MGFDPISVREIVPLAGVTPVPGAPAHVIGLVAVRGHVIAAFDPARFLGLADDEGARAAVAAYRPLLFMRAAAMQVGMVVDKVLGIRAIADDALKPVSVFQGRTIEPFVTAEHHGEHAVIALLDGDALVEAARAR